jgi:hypothetical protein
MANRRSWIDHYRTFSFNDGGQLVGQYTDKNRKAHGFTVKLNGRL